MEGEPDRSARLFERVNAGDDAARAELVATVYDELRRIAAREMRGQPGDHRLQVTALVHEAYARLVDADGRGARTGAAAGARSYSSTRSCWASRRTASTCSISTPRSSACASWSRAARRSSSC